MDEHILERVRRLLAIAHDTAASPNEQTVALERAQKLIDRHAIEQWELERDDPSRREPVTERFIPPEPVARQRTHERTARDRRPREPLPQLVPMA